MSVSSDKLTSQWLKVEACPACGSVGQSYRKPLLRDSYSFVGDEIAFPIVGIYIARCKTCNLVYKTAIPSPSLLVEMFSRHSQELWNESYDFVPEVQAITKLFPNLAFDLLDIGASDGGLLKACTQISGRRSGLDVVKYPGLDNWLRGEFIEGLIENVDLKWSGKPYDVVTVFDVLEHLYQPQVAFKNLATLVKSGGYVVIETGNVESFIPKWVGPDEWWYVHLFEHHIFWSMKALTQIAAQYGFYPIIQRSKSHKLLSTQSAKVHATSTIKLLSYVANVKLYKRVALMFGKKALPPWNTLLKDHIFVVLRKSI